MIKTERLVIREVSENDIINIHKLHSLPETDAFNTLGIPATIKVTEELVIDWIVKQKQLPISSYVFCIDNIDTKEFIGLIGLKIGKLNYKTAEVWFKTDVQYWRKGFTTEALYNILVFAFNTLKLHRIEAGCAVENIASIKVLEKTGFIREGRKRKILPIRGEWKDNYFYAILEEDFMSSNS